MSGLLDFALGFGAQAAKGYAQQREQEITSIREANLARIRAQYKKDVQRQEYDLQNQQTDRVADMIRLAREEGSAEAAAQLDARGIDWRQEAEEPKISNYGRIALDAGFERGTRAYQDFVRRQAEKQDVGTVVNFTEEQRSEFSQTLGKQNAEKYQEYQDNALRAEDQLAEINRIEAALESGKFETGFAAEPRQYLARLATFVNLNPEELGLGSAATADTISAAADKIAANLAGDVAEGTGMRGSNLLLRMVRQAGPELVKTPEGNRIINEVLKRKAQRQIEIGELADTYATQYGSFTPDIEGVPSFNAAVRNLNRNSPIIDETLRERIMTASDNAPADEEAWGGQGSNLPRVDFVVGRDSDLSYDETLSRLSDMGLSPGDRFYDANGNLKVVPGRN